MIRRSLAGLFTLLAGANLALAESPTTRTDADGPSIAEEMRYSWDEAADTSRSWLDGEYLLWWVKKGPNPVPLATTGPPSDMIPGALGQSGTVVLVGGSELDYRTFSGGRISAGCWLDSEGILGIEGSGFVLERRSIGQVLSSDAGGAPGIFRPLNDVPVGQDSFVVSEPGASAGSFVLSSRSRLWGAEANALATICQQNGLRLTMLGGFRYLDLDEGIDITTFTRDFSGSLCSPTNPGVPEPPGSTLTVVDSFHTRNQFYGGQLGLRAVYGMGGGLYVDIRGQVALGATRQIIDIGGSTAQTQPGLPSAKLPAGVLATVSNSGHFTHDEFSVVPQCQVRLGYELGSTLRPFVGYDFLYWSNVVRPGNQIGLNVDERSIPKACTFSPGFQAALPASPSFIQSDFWAQGVSFGLEVRY